MKYKKGVTGDALHPIMQTALYITEHIYKSQGYTLTVTSTNDGKHKLGSLHDINLAVDIRTRNIPLDKITNLYMDVKTQLKIANKNLQVILEKDHIHIEYDRRNKNV